MKYLLLLFAVATASFASSQAVGIGNASPSEMLDVTGNINLSGTIKANGAAGTNGQILMSTGAGLSWGSLMNYKKCIMFTSAVTGTFTVPAGVTEVMVELWGGGSGGTQYAGGTSGGYARTVQTVIPGSGIVYTVGSGSGPGVNSTSAASASQVTFTAGNIQALGGGGVVSNQVGPPTSGTGTITNNAYYMFGNSGEANTFSYGQKNSTTWVEVRKYGAGGAAPGMLNSTPVSGETMFLENGTTVYSMYTQNSKLPGSGGGAGIGNGWSGANGMIIFWFN